MKEGVVLKALAHYNALMQQPAESADALEDNETDASEAAPVAIACRSEDLLEATAQHTDLIERYCWLASLPTLSDDDIDQMDAILEQAESDPVLSFLISEADYLMGQRMGDLAESDQEAFANQQAWLREHLETSKDFSPKYAQEFQQLLKERGFYDGSVDGILGERTAAAILRFQQHCNIIVDGIPGIQTFVALWTGKDYYRELQKLLKRQGFYSGAIDGIWGIESRTALFKFQISNDHVKADGFPGPNTYLALKAHSKYHMQLQTLLKEKGFYDGEIDGVIGSKTRLAVKQFQASAGLTVDGVPGETTLQALMH